MITPHGGRGQHPRRDRLPQGKGCVLPDDRGPHAGGPGAVKRAGDRGCGDGSGIKL